MTSTIKVALIALLLLLPGCGLSVADWAEAVDEGYKAGRTPAPTSEWRCVVYGPADLITGKWIGTYPSLAKCRKAGEKAATGFDTYQCGKNCTGMNKNMCDEVYDG